MATFTVTTIFDEAFDDGDLASETIDGDGLSLREAIGLANETAAEDTIEFAPGVSGVIRMQGSEMVITENLVINGGGITITGDVDGDDVVSNGLTDVSASDAASYLDDNVRIFTTTADLVLNDITLTGGRTEVNFEDGGALRGLDGNATITINRSTIAGNSTYGDNAEGGAVYSTGDLNITDSTFSGNRTAGEASKGGAVFAAGELVVSGSTFSNNNTDGFSSDGGAIYGEGSISITNSAIFGNFTLGDRSFGGGVYGESSIDIINSTLAYNETRDRGYGAAIFANRASGVVTITQSTIVGNRTLAEILAPTNYSAAPAVYSDKDLVITNSIIIGNIDTQHGGPQLSRKNPETGQTGGAIDFQGVNIIGADTALANGTTVINAGMDDVFGGVLGDCGGPVPTIPLLLSALNPALDASGGRRSL